MFDSSITLLKKLSREFVKPYKQQLFIAVFAMIIVALANAFHAWLVKPALDDIFVHFNKKMLVLIPVTLVGVSVVKAFASYFQNYYMKFVGQRIVSDIQAKLYRHLIHADLGYLQQFSTGKIISRFSNDVITLRSSLSNVLTGIAKELLTVIFLLIVMFSLNFKLSILIFIIFPTAIYPIIKMGKKMRKISLKTQEQLGDFTTQLDETFKAIKEVKLYQAEKHETSKAKKILDHIFSLYVDAIRTESLSSPIIEIISGIAIALVIYYGGNEVILHNTSPGSFIAFIGAFVAAYRPIKNLAELNNNLQEGLSAAQRLFQVLEHKPSIVDKPDAYPLSILNPNVSFKNVNFNFNNQIELFNNLNFNLNAGQVVAFVGGSGSGKTTITNLLARFYQINNGEILVDNQNIHDVTLESLRKNITIVSQDVLLFDDTIQANIQYGQKDTKIEQIRQVAELAAANKFIEELPEQYQSLVGQNGLKLSGGQKQRISIARALLKNSPIIIFDEATSSLDSVSEQIIENSIFALKDSKKLIIIIAHRLSTIINCDQIFVLDKGNIVDFGTHQYLIKNCLYYQQLYQKYQQDK